MIFLKISLLERPLKLLMLLAVLATRNISATNAKYNFRKGIAI